MNLPLVYGTIFALAIYHCWVFTTTSFVYLMSSLVYRALDDLDRLLIGPEA